MTITAVSPPGPRVTPSYVVSDSGAEITAGEGCVPMDTHTVACAVRPGPLAPGIEVKVATGDLDDRIDLSANEPALVGRDDNKLCGGAGNDRINGSPAHDHLNGGPGDDVLRGGDSDDVMQGDGGGGECGVADDPGPNGIDTYFGGAGPDAILARDGLAEQIFCGPDVESVVNVDAVDSVADDCENVNVGP